MRKIELLTDRMISLSTIYMNIYVNCRKLQGVAVNLSSKPISANELLQVLPVFFYLNAGTDLISFARRNKFRASGPSIFGRRNFFYPISISTSDFLPFHRYHGYVRWPVNLWQFIICIAADSCNGWFFRCGLICWLDKFYSFTFYCILLIKSSLESRQLNKREKKWSLCINLIFNWITH